MSKKKAQLNRINSIKNITIFHQDIENYFYITNGTVANYFKLNRSR